MSLSSHLDKSNLWSQKWLQQNLATVWYLHKGCSFNEERDPAQKKIIRISEKSLILFILVSLQGTIEVTELYEVDMAETSTLGL